MQAVVLQLLQHARDRLAAWLGRYEAWHGVNGITERNLSFQVATSFLAQFADGVAFMEVPFSALLTVPWVGCRREGVTTPFVVQDRGLSRATKLRGRTGWPTRAYGRDCSVSSGSSS